MEAEFALAHLFTLSVGFSSSCHHCVYTCHDVRGMRKSSATQTGDCACSGGVTVKRECELEICKLMKPICVMSNA